MTLDRRVVMRVLGGGASGCNVVAPGPGQILAEWPLAEMFVPANDTGKATSSVGEEAR